MPFGIMAADYKYTGTARPNGMASGRLRLHQDPVERVGLCDAVPNVSRKEPLVAALSGAV
jgi:hypothetical protein